MDKESKKVEKEADGVLVEVYKDLVHPTAQPLGIMLSYLPRTIRLCFQKWEKWIINGEENLILTAEALKEKLREIPEEKICEPEPYIAIPAIQQIGYCFDSKELREMYANLLATSMNVDTKWSVHPSYVDIIKQLTPDEAKILNEMPRSPLAVLPLVELKVSRGMGRGSKTILRNIIEDRFYNVCDNPGRMSGYIDNLERLKLVTIPWDSHLVDKTQYNRIKRSEDIQNFMESFELKADYTLEFDEKIIQVTDFGWEFIKCCIDGGNETIIKPSSEE